MIWKEIITFTDSSTPYRFKVATSRSATGNQCNIMVDELDRFDEKIDAFEFVYDVEQNMPQADFKLHDKPIQALLDQMLAINDKPESW